MEIGTQIKKYRLASELSQEELAEKTARLNELNVLLKVDEKDKTLIDSVPDEGEEVPERKVVGLER